MQPIRNGEVTANNGTLYHAPISTVKKPGKKFATFTIHKKVISNKIKIKKSNYRAEVCDLVENITGFIG